MEKEEQTSNGTENVITSEEESKTVEMNLKPNVDNYDKIENNTNQDDKLNGKIASEKYDHNKEDESTNKAEIAAENMIANVDETTSNSFDPKSNIDKESIDEEDNSADHTESKDQTKYHVAMNDDSNVSIEDAGMYFIFDILNTIFSNFSYTYPIV